MAKKQVENEVPETLEVEALILPKVYDKRAYSVFEKEGEFHLVVVSYNKDLEVGTATIMESNRDSYEVMYSLEEATESILD